MESDDEWSEYFGAMEQLRKGATDIKKSATRKFVVPRARKPRAAKVGRRGPKAAPAASRSSRRLSKLEPIKEDIMEEEEEEEDDDDQIAASKRGRSEEIEFQSSPDMGPKKRIKQ